MMQKQYDVLFLSELAIGNTLEMMYAIEYCLKNGVKAAIYINKANKSFEEYLRKCYGSEVILSSLENIKVENLVHTFIVEEKVEVEYENYIYVNPDANSTQYMSETEQYLSVVKALYPSNYRSDILEMLVGDMTERVQDLDIENKYVIYPGCSSFAAVRRWPYYMELIEKLGADNVVVLGGLDDLNNEYAYTYKKIIPKIFPLPFTNRKSFWKICKKLNLLEPYAHNTDIEKLKSSYFNVFQWGELVSIFKHCKGFIGNDGGLMHLASCSGAKGVAIFGPTSVNKSRSYNPDIKEMHTNYDCQPCHFQVGKVGIGNHYISCPYQVKCLADISCDDVLKKLV